MKKCLLSIRKNGKDVANIFDQDGMENRVKFLFLWNKNVHIFSFLELFFTKMRALNWFFFLQIKYYCR
jgi:hypothetical protein